MGHDLLIGAGLDIIWFLICLCCIEQAKEGEGAYYDTIVMTCDTVWVNDININQRTISIKLGGSCT